MKCPAEATSWRQQGDWGWLGLEDEGNGCGQSSVSVWVDEMSWQYTVVIVA